MKGLAEFVKSCNECKLNLRITDSAFKDCNSKLEATTSTMVQVGVISAIIGILIGRASLR